MIKQQSTLRKIEETMKKTTIGRTAIAGAIGLGCVAKAGGHDNLEQIIRTEYKYWIKYFGLENAGLTLKIYTKMDKTHNGGFNSGTGTVVINLANIYKRSVEDYRKTIIHELVHVIQYAYFYKETKISSHYSHNIDYWTSSLEVNARAFADKLYEMRENKTLLPARQTIAWIEEDFMYRFYRMEKPFYRQNKQFRIAV